MQPIDNLEIWKEKMEDVNTLSVLSEEELIEWKAMEKQERFQVLKELLEKPIYNFPCVYSWYFRNKWGQALQYVKTSSPLKVLEIGSGDTDMLSQIMARLYNHDETTYTTANMNKLLTESLLNKTKNLPIKINVIADEAQNIEDYLGNNKVDVVVFEHSVNDVLQAMLGERDGIDTINNDWFEVLPQMIKIIKKEYLEGTLEASVKTEFLALIRSCLNVLKHDGYIVINHFQYQYDLNLGYEPYLWENMLPIVRKWIIDAGLGEEVGFEGFNDQWWMFIKKA